MTAERNSWPDMLREFLERTHSLTDTKVAEIAGVSRAAVAGWRGAKETGATLPTPRKGDTQQAILRYLGRNGSAGASGEAAGLRRAADRLEGLVYELREEAQRLSTSAAPGEAERLARQEEALERALPEIGKEMAEHRPPQPEPKHRRRAGGG